MATPRLRDPEPLHIQSNGMGVQSFVMYLMSSLGILPRLDYSIFVDPGMEKPKTYELFEWLVKWSRTNNGIPLIKITDKNLLIDSTVGVPSPRQSFSTMPLFTTSSKNHVGMLQRQCTSDYKIRQVIACIKKLYGKTGNQRLPETYVYLGITSDELLRVSNPEPVRFTHVYPFLQMSTGYRAQRPNFAIRGRRLLYWSRFDCIRWLSENKFPIPPKSSCYACPYTSNNEWNDMRINDPKTFEKACEFDEKVRVRYSHKLHQTAYIHRSLSPLRDIDFSREANEDSDECSGYCHV